MILFHGSDMNVVSPDISRGDVGKDFGNGFYLASEQIQAEDFAYWKCDDSLMMGYPTVNAYQCPDNILNNTNLRIQRFDEYNEAWVDFVYFHRKCKRKITSKFDVVYGPIADGNMKVLFPKYEANEITKEELLEGLKSCKAHHFQYFFGTERAIRYLHYCCAYQLLEPNTLGALMHHEHTNVDGINWELDSTVRVEISTSLKIPAQFEWVENSTIDDLLNKNISHDDKRKKSVINSKNIKYILKGNKSNK